MDVFEELAGGGGAVEAPLGHATSAASASASVLVVPEKAPSGQALHVEEMVFLRTVRIPQVVFESVDQDSNENVFDNEMEFRHAMDLLSPVSIEAALAWSGERVGPVYAAHREEIDAANAGQTTQSPGVGAIAPRAKMPHSTGRDRGQKK
ncbi:hypothetical protein [Bradyrhizobium sp. CW11]|uniref:hypothetical protein n=1 Tax=Bradyrhizobium sp. CW11 TaxID=2782684 RepID=UPI001FFB3425|nr:hypothetical protein [Bradyrhizobium sp. CW11]MCK1346027.1 hypothetical protein [Bradyrhizobium sp. CW11]